MFMFCLAGFSSCTINTLFYILCVLPKASLEANAWWDSSFDAWLAKLLFECCGQRNHSDYNGIRWSTAMSADKKHSADLPYCKYFAILLPCQLWTRQVPFWACFFVGSVLFSENFGCSLQEVPASVVMLVLELLGESCAVSSWWDSVFTPQMLHSQ